LSEGVLTMAKKKTAQPNDPASSTSASPRRRTPRHAAAAVAADTASAAPPAEPTFDQIAEEAYQRYLRRGGQHGQDFDDWLEAERALKRK
jgi:hypothetical protein